MSWVQTVGVQVVSAASGTTAGITTTSGNSIAIQVGTSPAFGGDVSATTPVQDSKGNTWTLQQTSTSATVNNKQRVYTATNITGGAGHTFTVNLATAGFADLNVGESSNTGGLDGAGAQGNDTTGQTSHPGSSFTATAGADWFQGMVSDSGTNPQTQTAGATWTKGSAQPDGSSGTAGFSQFKSAVSGGANTSPFTTGDSVTAGWTAIGFKAGAAGDNLHGQVCI